MAKKLRLFVAVELPESAKSGLGKVIDALNTSDIPGIRTVRSEGIHLTLKFLGDVDADRVEAVTEALSKAVAGHAPFRLELGEVGAFPTLRRPRVLWVGINGDTEALASLQSDIEAALEAAGFAGDDRGYNPHLTLARLRPSIRYGPPPPSGKSAADVLKETPIEPGTLIPVERVSLMRTELHPDGAIHRRLVSIPL